MVWVPLVLLLVVAVSAVAVALVAYGRAPLPKDPPGPPAARHEADGDADHTSDHEH